VLGYVRQIEDENTGGRTMGGLAPHLPDSLLHEVLTATRQIEDEHARARALAGLALYLPGTLLPDALAAARQIKDNRDRAWALVDLAPHLPELLLSEALAAARQIKDEHARARALAGLAPRLAALPYPIIARLWAEPQDGLPLLHSLARRSRSDLLADLRALAPVLATLGGEEAIAEIFRAIQDVGRWWP
jgi:hypothetical protein